MTASVVYAVFLAAAGLMTQVAADSAGDDFIVVEICTPQTVSFFNISLLCGKLFTTVLVTGVDLQSTCIATRFECQNDNTVRATEYTFVDFVELTPQVYTLSDNGDGSVSLTYADNTLVEFLHYINSYSEYEDFTAKFTWVRCPSVFGSPSLIAVLSSYPADTTDEWNNINKRYPSVNLLVLPDTCGPPECFPGL